MPDQLAVNAALEQYYRAFSTLNVEAIVPFFHQPAVIMGSAGVFAMLDAASLINAIGPVMEQLRSRGYSHSELQTHELKQLSATAASVTGVAVRYQAGGQELERVGITYLLQKSAGQWKIAVMVVHDLPASSN